MKIGIVPLRIMATLHAKALSRCCDGRSFVEYAILLGLVAAAIVLAFSSVATGLQSYLCKMATKIGNTASGC